MSTALPHVPAPATETVGDDIAGMGSFFIDPAGAARRLPHKWFWVGPLVVAAIVTTCVVMLSMPIVRHVMETQPLPPNTSPEQYQKVINITATVQRMSMFFSPVIAAAMWALEALIVFAMCAVFSIKAGFRSLFNLVAGCGLITALGAIASVAVLKGKGEISSMAELHPPLGFDIFLGEGTNKVLLAIVSYFSVFEIWWIVMAVLIFSVAFRVSKGKAFGAISPLIILSLLFKIVGALFQRT